nr:tetratricopeptide repeat protein [Bacteroidota bacterium]
MKKDIKKPVTPVKSTKAKADNAGETSLGMWGAIICAAFAFVIYANTLNHSWALDDFPTIYGNRITMQGVDSIPTLMSTAYWYGLDGKNDWLYRPLSMVMFAIEWEIAPNTPALGHWVNVLFYSLTAFMLFKFLAELFKGKNILFPLSIALIYIAHPIHTEVVANIKSRDEIMSFLFMMLTMYNVLLYARYGKMQKLILAFVFYTLALFSKESAITLIGVIPLLLFFFTDVPYSKYAKPMMAVGAAAVIYLVARGNVLTSQTAQEGILISDNSLVSTDNVMMQKATAFYIIGLYIKLLFFPHPMSCDYSFNEIKIVGFDNWLALSSLIFHVAIGVYALVRLPKKDPVSFGILFYLITISLVTNVLFLTRSTMADRFLYTPSLGFCIVVVVLLERLLKINFEEKIYSLSRIFTFNTTYTAIVSVVLIAASLKTFSRNRDWESDTTIFSTDSRHAPGSARIHYLYGNHFLQELNQKKVPQDQQENYWNIAVAELKKSIECHADYMESYMGLGDCYARKGMFKEAFDIYNVAIKRKPDFANAHNSLGNCYFKAGQYDNAILALQQAIKIQPDYAEAYNNMGSAYFSKGDYANAVTAFQTAIRISPTYVDAHKNLGSAYGTMKDYDKSIASFLNALKFDPNSAEINRYLGLTYQFKGDMTNGTRYLNRAYELDPSLKK